MEYVYVIEPQIITLVDRNVVKYVSSLKWNGLMCPCCRHKLRTRPRNPKLYEKLRKKEQ
jgi:hypothetical protein